MVADLQSSLLAGTSPKCCSVPRCSNPTATARPTKMHPATKTNSKFDDPGPISVSAPVVLLQMHRPSNLMVAIITRDRPRSQYANTDVSLRINSFQGGNRVGQHGRTHTHISRLPRPTTHSHGTPPTRRHRETSLVPSVLAGGGRPKSWARRAGGRSSLAVAVCWRLIQSCGLLATQKRDPPRRSRAGAGEGQ